MILLCGKNARVAAKLRALGQRIPMFIEGFTREVPFYMELADFFIGKPGPGSISEALAKRLPVIVQRNAWTLAHERYNADWVEEQGTGLVVRDFRQAEIGTMAVENSFWSQRITLAFAGASPARETWLSSKFRKSSMESCIRCGLRFIPRNAK